MKKLFVVSDVHGHFKELNKALAKAGIEAIITNYPDKARKIIQETGGTGNV